MGTDFFGRKFVWQKICLAENLFGGNLFGGKFVWQKICLAEILDWSVEELQGVRKILVFFFLEENYTLVTYQ